jgi:hypothetical protein
VSARATSLAGDESPVCRVYYLFCWQAVAELGAGSERRLNFSLTKINGLGRATNWDPDWGPEEEWSLCRDWGLFRLHVSFVSFLSYRQRMNRGRPGQVRQRPQSTRAMPRPSNLVQSAVC